MNAPPLPAMSRRRFLVQTGIGLAAVSTLSSAMAQTAAPAAAVKRLRIGLVGCGGRGKFVGNLFAAHGGFEIAGAADVFADRVQEVAAKFNLAPAQTFTGLQCCEKMIAQGGLDAIGIFSPPYFHPAQAQAAVAAGLHVYVAKPVAVDVPGCRSIQETARHARAKGIVMIVDFQTRPNEFFVEAMRRVHDGAIGDMVFGESTYHAGRIPTKVPPGTPEARLRNWVFDRALSGDIIVEQNIHTLDVMSWAMQDSPPLRCTGTGGRKVRTDVGDCWDYFTLVYDYPKQVGITFSSRQFDAHGAFEGIVNRMFGTKGVLQTQYGGEVMIRGGAGTFYRGGKTDSIYLAGPGANIAAFHEAVLARNAANPTVEKAVTSNLVTIMGRMAAYENRTVEWDEVLKSQQRIQADLSGLPV